MFRTESPTQQVPQIGGAVLALHPRPGLVLIHDNQIRTVSIQVTEAFKRNASREALPIEITGEETRQSCHLVRLQGGI